MTNPSWSSFERSSRVLPFVSGSRSVEKIPVSMKNAKISKLARRQSLRAQLFNDDHTHMCFTNLLVPPIFTILAKPTCATMAPVFPLAAEIPWAVERYRVGKASPGITKVVMLGPKFWKKLAKQ